GGDALLVAADNLYRVALPGGARTELATGLADVAAGAYSPDGTKIAFLRFGDLTVIDADGSHPVHVTNSSLAAWSPDSTRLAFGQLGHGVFVVRADGGGRHR